MNRAAVKSEQIASIGYDVVTQTLEIEFRSKVKGKTGSVYQYTDVPASTHAALLSAGSIGTQFGIAIKDRFKTFKQQPDGSFVPLSEARASGQSIDFVRKLAKRAELWTGDANDRISPAWTGVIAAAGTPYPGDVMVETWLGGLLQSQCSAVIAHLKALQE